MFYQEPSQVYVSNIFGTSIENVLNNKKKIFYLNAVFAHKSIFIIHVSDQIKN